MTHHPANDPHDQTVDHWLTQHQHALTDALDNLLDVEAGLREILLHSHHDTATDNLDTVLDTEAGLAAILPATPQTPAADAPDTPHDHTDTGELLRTISPTDRMTLRNHPAVKAASQALTRDLDRAQALDRVLDLNLDLNRVLDLVLDLVLGRDLDPAVVLDRALALDRARDLALGRDRDLAVVLDLARTRAIDLAVVLDLDRARTSTSTSTIARARDLARDLARTLDLNLNRVLDLGRAVGLAVDLDHALVDVRTAEVCQAIGLALRREPPALDKDSLHTLLDDFTTADLSDADLTSTDLSGVRWSEHGTQWPPVIDIEDLKIQSDETPPGSGTWTIRSGTATIRDLAEL